MAGWRCHYSSHSRTPGLRGPIDLGIESEVARFNDASEGDGGGIVTEFVWPSK